LPGACSLLRQSTAWKVLTEIKRIAGLPRQPASADCRGAILHRVHTKVRKLVAHTIPTVEWKRAGARNDPCPVRLQSAFQNRVCALIWNPEPKVGCRRVIDVRANQVRRTRWIAACGSAILALRCDSIIRWQINRWTAQLAAISGIPRLLNQRIVWAAHTIYLTRKNDR
jgi:hypothetical protein